MKPWFVRLYDRISIRKLWDVCSHLTAFSIFVLDWVSELFSGVPSQPQSITNRVAAYSTGHAEEDEEEEEEEVCEEDDGWDDEDSDDFDEDDNDDDNDDDDVAFDVIDSDMDDSDDDNIEVGREIISFSNSIKCLDHVTDRCNMSFGGVTDLVIVHN